MWDFALPMNRRRSMTTMIESAGDAVRARAEPIREAVEENLRDVRRAVVAGRHAVEDAAAEATIRVRRHPFLSTGVALGIGTLFGCLIGFAAGRCGGGRISR
jgi:ElaB/YqjD/DUF883 family membrane-anchored ribosome-binding protein